MVRDRSGSRVGFFRVLILAAATSLLLMTPGSRAGEKNAPNLSEKNSEKVASYKSPQSLVFSPNGRFVYVANHTDHSVSKIDTESSKVVARIPTGRGPVGLALGPMGNLLFVTNSLDHSVSFIQTETGKTAATVRCGFEPMGIAAARDGKRLYVANYISDDVSVIDVEARKEIRRIAVGRAPSYLALTPDGKKIVVNNVLARGPATDPKRSSYVSVIDVAQGKEVEKKYSPGTMLLGQGIAVSPDGKFAYSVHSRPNFNVTPSQLQQGWVHNNALSIIPLTGEGKVRTVLLDNVSSGMANPYEVALSKDARLLFVTHRGTHQISVVDLSKLRNLLKYSKPEVLDRAHLNLGFLWGDGEIVRRIPSGGLGPQGIAVSPRTGDLYVANYYSDLVSVIDGKTLKWRENIRLGKPKEMDLVRRGDFLFHDGAHCFQQWLSCSSCHPKTRSDGVNWDLLNDGITNPKNAKSLVGSWDTPPAMALGVRASMEVAVEKGFKFIQFVVPLESDLQAVRAYLRAIPHIPSPWHRNPDGSLDMRAERGRKLFKKADCVMCHPAPLYSTLESYNVGTRGERDYKEHTDYDTPSLRELYRTAPYLHDGRAATLREVLTKFNKNDDHGTTSDLSSEEIQDLEAFLMTL